MSMTMKNQGKWGGGCGGSSWIQIKRLRHRINDVAGICCKACRGKTEQMSML